MPHFSGELVAPPEPDVDDGLSLEPPARGTVRRLSLKVRSVRRSFDRKVAAATTHARASSDDGELDTSTHGGASRRACDAAKASLDAASPHFLSAATARVTEELLLDG